LISEGLLFVFLGISTWQIKSDSEEGVVIHDSWTFVLLTLLILVIARIFNIILMNYLFKPFKGK